MPENLPCELAKDMVNTSSQKTPAPFKSALLLVRSDDVAAVDKRALREVGVRNVKVFSSGVAAARELAQAAQSGEVLRAIGPDMVLCHEQLADMTGDDFVRLIRLHPALVPFPALVAVASDTPAARLRAQEAGYSGLLIRPYTPAKLDEQLRIAAECEAATRAALGPHLNGSYEAFEGALETLARDSMAQSCNVEQVYRGALLSLREQRWDEAAAALQRAAKLAPENGDVVLALAAAWRGKNNSEKSQAMLREAVSVFVDAGAWDRALAVSERFLRELPGAPSPLLHEARRLLASGKAEDAAKALLHGGFSSSQAAGSERTAWIYEQVARGCMATSDPEAVMDRLRDCLTGAGEERSAAALRDYVLYRAAGGESALDSRRRCDSPITFAADGNEPATGDTDEKSRLRAPLNEKTPPPAVALLKEPSTPSALAAFPLLRDALAVAKVTFGLFRSGKKKPKGA